MMRKTNKPKQRPRARKRPDMKSEAIKQVRKSGFDKETTESLIREIEEICAFEDSLEEF